MAAKAADSKAKSAAPAAAGVSAGVSADFKFPDFYHFPPFFTLQPVSGTRAKQVALWRDFVLSYVAANRSQQTYVLADEQKKPLFCNAKIDRKLPLDVCQMLFHDLIQQGYGEWLDAQRAGAVLSWRRFDDWSASLWSYAKSHNLIGNVTTVYDLSAGDDTAGADFHGLDHRLLLRALQVLEKQNRVTLLRGANTAETGVKFLDSP